MMQKNRELKLIFWVIVAIFMVFLVAPILILIGKSVWDTGPTLQFFADIVKKPDFMTALHKDRKSVV